MIGSGPHHPVGVSDNWWGPPHQKPVEVMTTDTQTLVVYIKEIMPVASEIALRGEPARSFNLPCLKKSVQNVMWKTIPRLSS